MPARVTRRACKRESTEWQWENGDRIFTITITDILQMLSRKQLLLGQEEKNC